MSCTEGEGLTLPASVPGRRPPSKKICLSLLVDVGVYPSYDV